MDTYLDVSKVILVGTVINKGKQMGRVSFVSVNQKDKEEKEATDKNSKDFSGLSSQLNSLVGRFQI